MLPRHDYLARVVRRARHLWYFPVPAPVNIGDHAPELEQIDHTLVKTHITRQGEDLLAQTLHHLHQPEGADGVG